ncbi:MAG: sigma 54-interacting transcriptional regulator, partial [Syntrophales bacterium]|nr:sigma 54-interacting transcriptional regulator [Syntrophales bacterium]
EAIDLVNPEQDKNSLALLEMYLAKNEWMRSRFKNACRHFKKGVAFAEKTKDPKTLRSVAVFNLFFSFWMGKFREAIQNYEACTPDVDNFPQDSIPLLASLTAGSCYGYCGQLSHGLGMIDAVRTHGRKIGNLHVAAHAAMSIGELLVCVNSFEEARKYLEESVRDALSCHNIFAYIGSLNLLSYTYYKINEPQKAVSLLNESMELMQRFQVALKHGFILMSLAWAQEEGALPANRNLSLKNEIKNAFEGGNIFTKGLACRYQALSMKQKGAPASDVIAELKRSVKYLNDSGNEVETAYSRVELAREYMRSGNSTMAKKWAKPALEILSSINDELLPDDLQPLVASQWSGETLLNEILRLSQELVGIRDSRYLFRQIISSVNSITGAERGAIFLADTDNPRNMTLRAAKNLTAEDIHTPQFEEPMKLIRETFKTGKGLVMDFDDGKKAPVKNNLIRSCICVPMNIRNKMVGVLYHDNRIFRSVFKKADLDILNYFAAQAAIAMDNVEAWKALQDMYEKQQKEKEYFESQYKQTILSEDFIGESPAIAKVFHEIEQVAGTDATVLITGETGSGKELVARTIHNHSTRRDKPFIRVHCSCLPESLISSELFGHERGAFTGAVAKQIGRFELADGGTLFLDEIGDISMDIQVKLLRVLQSREFERVGGSETIRSDFRLLTATNRDLKKEVQAGRFRQDLYYRLNIFPIHVPPLRERKEDIPLLVEYFLKTCAAKHGKQAKKITKSEMEKLLAYDWPGNVRELENLIERGLILINGRDFKTPAFEHHKTASGNDNDCITIEENERRHILKILEKTGGKIAGKGGAAEILGIPPSTLNSRMKKLGIKKYYSSYYLNASPRH